MKIFKKFYARRLYRARRLEEILDILDPWIEEVLRENSPFLRQVASYHLRQLGSSFAPRLFKNVVASEILRLNDSEDLRAAAQLAIVISYRSYDSFKGDVSLVTWLAWRIPYELSKLVTWRVAHPVRPFEEEFLPPEIEEFDRTLEIERQIGILCTDLELKKQAKYYYLQKAKEQYATSS